MISDASSVEDNNRTTGMKLALLAWEPRKLAKRAIVTVTVINMLAAPAAADLSGLAAPPTATTGRGTALTGAPSGDRQSFSATMTELGSPQSDGISGSLLPADLAVNATAPSAQATVLKLNPSTPAGLLATGEPATALEQLMSLPDPVVSLDLPTGNVLPETSPEGSLETGNIVPLVIANPELQLSTTNAAVLQQVTPDPTLAATTNVTPQPVVLMSRQSSSDAGLPTPTDDLPTMTSRPNAMPDSALQSGLSNSGQDQPAFEMPTPRIENAMRNQSGANLAALITDSGPVDLAQFAAAQSATVQSTSQSPVQINQLMDLPQFQNMRPLQPMADPQAFMEGLGQRLMVMTDAGVQSARLKLHPENLGALDIKIQIDDDAARVWFTAQNGHAREALESALPKLRELFAQQGMDLLQADVGSGQDQRSSSNEPFDRVDTAYSGSFGGDSGMSHDPVERPTMAYVSQRALDIYV